MTRVRGEVSRTSPGWARCLAHLKAAVIRTQDREEFVRRALGEVCDGLSATAVALLRRDEFAGWQVECVGDYETGARRWLSERLAPTLTETISAISGEVSGGQLGSPNVTSLDVGVEGRDGVVIVFVLESASVAEVMPDEVREAVRLLVEVESLEAVHLGEGVTVAGMDFARLRHDPARLMAGEGLREILALSLDVSGADFTYWGSVRDGVLDVEWNIGARDSGFGFELPLGEGIGGRAFARGEAFEVEDYLNCRYRYPGVSEATDSERVRTALAIPLHGERSGAVLYAVRREVETFTAAQRAMLMQVRDAVQPIPGAWSYPGSLYVTGRDHLRLQKSELRRLLLECERVSDLETWLERVVRGPVISLDGCGHPYLPANLSRLDALESDGRRRDYDLPGGRSPGGSVALWPTDELPPVGWPDLIDDALAAFGVVLDRVEQTRERLGRQRSQWLHSASEGSATDDLKRDGNRLGLPTHNGEIWAFAWDTDREQPRLRMLADDVVLDLLGGPMIVLEDGLGVVLLRDPGTANPSAVRDELLRHVGPTRLWLSHGASYETFDGLRGALLRATGAVISLRRTDNGTFVTGVDGRDLDSLLGNPALSSELSAFAEKMLSPLLEHDVAKNTSLTETFCRSLVSGSPGEAAAELFVHPNTVRYRMRRAEGILSADLARPEDRTALTLAAFVWLREGRI